MALGRKRTHEELVAQLNNIHPSYKLLEKFTGQRYIKCRCLTHKTEFIIDKVNNIGSKQHKCPECKTASKRKASTVTLKQKEFEQKILALFPDHKVKGTYVNVNTPVEAFCRKHKLDFFILPNNALYNGYAQCPGCYRSPYDKKNNRVYRTSIISQEWLKFVCKQKGWKFKYLLCSSNGPEHYIKGVGHVDGFHKPSNTVLEFHGDYWHGNPRKYKPDHQTFNGSTAKDLYKKTKAKEKKILALGYNLITMWELDYRLLTVDSKRS